VSKTNSLKNLGKNFRKFLVALGAVALPHMAHAQEVGACDWRASARNIVEPWADNTRLFSNGKVRLTLMDTVEPAAGAFHLLIISPPYNELGEPQCAIISRQGSIGFAGLNFNELEAGYDPATGLTFILPGTIYLPEEGFSNSFQMAVTLNQASGDISLDMALGNE